MKTSDSAISDFGETKGIKVTDEEKVCFVISPIGKEGTDIHEKFKDMLDYVVRPAVSNSGYKLRVLRADDIERAGSFIKDILEYLLNSFIVIADLTDKNPNVFYELGVRHSLSSKTILIARSLDDIPADLRDYRTIIYDTTAKGATTFTKRLSNYLKEIFDDPNRADNPVLDRLPSILETQTEELKAENASLKTKITQMLRQGPPTPKKRDVESVTTRVGRIFALSNAIEQDGIITSGSFTREVNDERVSIQLLTEQGNFQLYFRKREKAIFGFWYVAIVETEVSVDRELADIRVLMEDCHQKAVSCTFIIATNNDLSAQAELVRKKFEKMKTIVKIEKGTRYQLETWDKEGLLIKEKELGIKIEI